MKRLIYLLLLVPFFVSSQKTIVFYTDFETDQWSTTPGANEWENDPGEGTIRTTAWTGAAPAPAITAGRDGTGRAVWMGTHSDDSSRSELFRDRVIRTDVPTYVGYSIYINERLPSSRAYSQMRNMKQSSDPVNNNAAKNPYMLRQHSDNGKLFFNLLTDPTVAQTNPGPTGASEGALFWPNVAGPTVQGTDGSVAADYGFDFNMNEWIDIVIYWDALDYDTDNTLKIWVNGDLVVDWYGVTNRRYMPENSEGNYLEVSGDLKHNIGTYWASAGVQGNAYFDEYRVCEGAGCTYEDASPLGLSPNGAPLSSNNVLKSGRIRGPGGAYYKIINN
ncbi:hypothetical protein [Flagellimonas flava]|uniref:hypothetical protein n=1 Tax=Flagellimonas flava TaxID=570519 RepID=UPI003D64E0C0